MSNAEFDKYATEYDQMHRKSIAASGYEPSFFDEYKIIEMVRYLSKEVASQSLKILNFGCGIGKSEPLLLKHFPNSTILGIDVSSESIELAKAQDYDFSKIHFEVFDGTNINLSEKYDIIYIANVFHHIPHSEHKNLTKQLCSLLTEKGKLFMFEHNPYNPLTLRTVKQCEFDVDAVLLPPGYSNKLYSDSGFTNVSKRFTLFFPKFLTIFRPLEPFLHWLPLGAQYYIVASKLK